MHLWDAKIATGMPTTATRTPPAPTPPKTPTKHRDDGGARSRATEHAERTGDGG